MFHVKQFVCCGKIIARRPYSLLQRKAAPRTRPPRLICYTVGDLIPRTIYSNATHTRVFIPAIQ